MYLGDAHLMTAEEGFWGGASAAQDGTNSRLAPVEQSAPPILQDMPQLLQAKVEKERNKKRKVYQLEKKDTQRIHRLKMVEGQEEVLVREQGARSPGTGEGSRAQN
jgi:hypothetical protein